MPMPQMVFNRSQTQVSNYLQIRQRIINGNASAIDKARFLADMQGAYNASDLNRVGTAILYLQTELASYGITVTLPTVKTDFAKTDVPTITQMNDYLSAVSILRGAISLTPLTPDVPSTMQGLTYEEANAIEKILDDVYYTLEAISAAFRYCGTPTAICGISEEGSIR